MARKKTKPPQVKESSSSSDSDDNSNDNKVTPKGASSKKKVVVKGTNDASGSGLAKITEMAGRQGGADSLASTANDMTEYGLGSQTDYTPPNIATDLKKIYLDAGGQAYTIPMEGGIPELERRVYTGTSLQLHGGDQDVPYYLIESYPKYEGKDVLRLFGIEIQDYAFKLMSHYDVVRPFVLADVPKDITPQSWSPWEVRPDIGFPIKDTLEMMKKTTTKEADVAGKIFHDLFKRVNVAKAAEGAYSVMQNPDYASFVDGKMKVWFLETAMRLSLESTKKFITIVNTIESQLLHDYTVLRPNHYEGQELVYDDFDVRNRIVEILGRVEIGEVSASLIKDVIKATMVNTVTNLAEVPSVTSEISKKIGLNINRSTEATLVFQKLSQNHVESAVPKLMELYLNFNSLVVIKQETDKVDLGKWVNALCVLMMFPRDCIEQETFTNCLCVLIQVVTTISAQGARTLSAEDMLHRLNLRGLEKWKSARFECASVNPFTAYGAYRIPFGRDACNAWPMRAMWEKFLESDKHFHGIRKSSNIHATEYLIIAEYFMKSIDAMRDGFAKNLEAMLPIVASGIPSHFQNIERRKTYIRFTTEEIVSPPVILLNLSYQNKELELSIGIQRRIMDLSQGVNELAGTVKLVKSVKDMTRLNTMTAARIVDNTRTYVNSQPPGSPVALLFDAVKQFGGDKSVNSLIRAVMDKGDEDELFFDRMIKLTIERITSEPVNFHITNYILFSKNPIPDNTGSKYDGIFKRHGFRDDVKLRDVRRFTYFEFKQLTIGQFMVLLDSERTIVVDLYLPFSVVTTSVRSATFDPPITTELGRMRIVSPTIVCTTAGRETPEMQFASMKAMTMPYYYVGTPDYFTRLEDLDTSKLHFLTSSQTIRKYAVDLITPESFADNIP